MDLLDNYAHFFSVVSPRAFRLPEGIFILDIRYFLYILSVSGDKIT